jgi:hypothetical protein
MQKFVESVPEMKTTMQPPIWYQRAVLKKPELILKQGIFALGMREASCADIDNCTQRKNNKTGNK